MGVCSASRSSRNTSGCSMGLSIEELGMVLIVMLCVFVIGLVVAAPFMLQVPPEPYATPTPISTPSPTPAPKPTATPHASATPTLTPTPPSTPTPEPSATPEPTPSPSPAPAWMVKGYVCEVPDRLFGEPWAEEFKFSCACVIRGKWDLGPSFNVWEGCYSTTSSGWRRESCECVEIICKARRELC
jgi:hypothetical protein